jgi:hypothetical protein
MGQLIQKLALHRFANICAMKIRNVTGISIIGPTTCSAIIQTAPHVSGLLLGKESIKQPQGSLPEGAADLLRYDNPYLQSLRDRYANHPATEHSHWTTSMIGANLDLRYFRADNIYLFQSRRYSPLSLYGTAAFAERADAMDLMNQLFDDDYFGAELFDFHGKAVSRDLVDSVIEINFLERHLKLSRLIHELNVLDIGAGYGRLACRFLTAFPDAKYTCVDAVPESTFICDYYTSFRNISDRCTVLPLDRLGVLKPGKIDLAVNVHSFAECRGSTISWWLKQLRDLQVPYLFIATGSNLGLTSHELGGTRRDFRLQLQDFGFVEIASEDKFNGAPILQHFGIYPARYYLFGVAPRGLRSPSYAT